MYLTNTNFYQNAKQVQLSIPMSGHTVGYFMTSNMIKHRGKEYVLTDFGNPYMFVKRYNEIAKENNLPTFSENSVKLLKELEQRYNYRKYNSVN